MDQSIETIIRQLSDDDQTVQKKARVALVQRDANSVRDLLIALSGKNYEFQSSVLHALGHLADPRVCDTLFMLLDDPEYRVRACAAEALSAYGPTIVHLLIRALTHPHSNVRQFAALALGLLGDTAAVEPLIGRLDDTSDDVRWFAVVALGELADTRAVEPLLTLIHDADADIRHSSLEALAKIGDLRALAPLLAALTDADSSIRVTAIFAFRQLKHPAAIQPLIALFTDAEDDYIPFEAVETLRDIGDAAIEPLFIALLDKNDAIRRGSAWALSLFEEPKIVDRVIALLESPESTVRVYGIQALAYMESVQAVPTLDRVLHTDPNKDVREVAEKAIEIITHPTNETVQMRLGLK